MRRTEREPSEPSGPDLVIRLGCVLTIAGIVASVVSWLNGRVSSTPWPAWVLVVSVAFGVAGLLLTATRVVVLGPSQAWSQAVAESARPEPEPWESRHPAAFRLIAALFAVAALVAIPFLVRRLDAESFELSRGAAIAFFLLAGLAADAVWSSEFGRDRFPSAGMRALAAVGTALLAAPPSLLYWRWTGLAAPWKGVWSEGGIVAIVLRIALEAAIFAVVVFAAPLLRWFRGRREDEGRA